MTAQGAFNHRCSSRRNHRGHAELTSSSAHAFSAGWRLGALQHLSPARSGPTAAATPWTSAPAHSASPSATPASTASAASCSCAHRRLGSCGPASTRRQFVSCAAYGRGTGGSDSNYYELLGLEPDCDEEDIRAAFRRRAKELHPDVNKEEGATEAFVQLSRAYEVLSDEESRRQYDITHRTRRLNFFRDVVEQEEEEEERGGRRSSFRWSQMGRRPGGGLRPDEDEDGGRRGGREEDEDDDEGEDEDEEGSGWQRGRSQEEVLQELAKFMSGPGSLRAWQSGRLDPWGTSTSDAWFRQVERQTRSPYGPARPGYGSSRDDDDDDYGFGGAGREWDPSRRAPGWSPPGRGSEWSHPRRQWDEEDRRGGGPGRQGGGGGDFRRPFKI